MYPLSCFMFILPLCNIYMSSILHMLMYISKCLGHVHITIHSTLSKKFHIANYMTTTTPLFLYYITYTIISHTLSYPLSPTYTTTHLLSLSYILVTFIYIPFISHTILLHSHIILLHTILKQFTCTYYSLTFYYILYTYTIIHLHFLSFPFIAKFPFIHIIYILFISFHYVL